VAIAKRKRLVVLAILAVLAGGVAALALTPAGESMARRFGLGWLEENGRTIRVSGNIEVVQVEVGFKIPGWVEERPVDEGYAIAQGDLVARLEQSDLRCDVALRKADLEFAQASLAELEHGSRQQEIESARAAKAKAKAAWEDLQAGSREQEKAAAWANVLAAMADEAQLKSDLARSEALRKPKAVSERDYDRAKAAYEVAVERLNQAFEQWLLVMEGSREQQIEQAKAAYEQASAQCALVEEGPRYEVIDQARAKVKQARAALDLAETRLKYATVKWPPANAVLPQTARPPIYVVLSKNLEPGEYAAPGKPVITVGEMANVWLRAYINETDLGRVKLGQRARVTTDTYPGVPYEGRVSFIASQAEFTPKNVQTEKERVKLVYRIKIDIDNPNMELKPGMPADAEICTPFAPNN